jgi:CHAD domain-containing protein
VPEGKWITDVTPAMPLAEAARRVIAVRLDLVLHYLPLATHEAERDPENVHQLRVATRRAGAALRTFRICLPTKAYRDVRRTLRTIRRAAGSARDWDVFLAKTTAWGARQVAPRRPGVDFLLGYATAHRAAAQQRLVESASKFLPTASELIAEIAAAIQNPEDRTLCRVMDIAPLRLSQLLGDLDAAAMRDPTDYQNLHQVRIAGKRLRYAMELFGSCFAKPFRTVIYPAVEEMQGILGRANDSHVAAGALQVLWDSLPSVQQAIWRRSGPGIEALLRHHRQQLPRERKRFLAWWKRWKNEGTEAALIEMLRAAASARCSDR